MLFRFSHSVLRSMAKSSEKTVKNSLATSVTNVEQDTGRQQRTLPASILQKLTSCKVTYTEGFTCYQIKDCHLCQHSPDNLGHNDMDIYINKVTGHFTCERCKCSGNWDIFNQLLEQNKAGNENKIKQGCLQLKNHVEDWMKVIQESEPLHELNNESYFKTLGEFQLSECDKNVVKQLNCHVSKDQKSMYFPLCSSEGIVLGYITYTTEGRAITRPHSDCGGVLMAGKAQSEPVVLVSDIPDLMALLSQGIKENIICLPYGKSTLPQQVLPSLEKYEKLILWFDGTSDSAFTFGNKLNHVRCFTVKHKENQNSPSMAVHTQQDISKIIAEAHPLRNDFITNFSSLRADVLLSIQKKEEACGIKWKRFPKLNKILQGHRRGELTILTGGTGSGKTTFMSEYSLDLAMQGVNTLWGSFEIKNTRLACTMLRQFARLPLGPDVDQFNLWADEFEKLPIYFMTFHGRQTIEQVMQVIEYGSYVSDIAHVIIDNLQFMIGVSDHESKHMDRFWKQDLIIHKLRAFATENNCHVTLVIHPRKETEELTVSSIFGGAKATQEADNVLLIQDRRLGPTPGVSYLQVAKNRFAGELGELPLNYNKECQSFSTKQTSETETEDDSEDKDDNDSRDSISSGFRRSEITTQNPFELLFPKREAWKRRGESVYRRQ